MINNETNVYKKVALLATGDELTRGDILNTNAQYIAQRLFETGIAIGLHMVADDQQTTIEQAITYLLQEHDAIIITGGLGPTSDDRTRFAVAAVTHHMLVFDDSAWENIVTRIKRFGFNEVPESNKRQALFPLGATIFPNPNGTAAGCGLIYQNKWIFMLPGPPAECRPMFENYVIPTLINVQFPHVFYYKKWFLFGVSEGHIAAQLDPLAEKYACTVGYRIIFPYIEFKISAENKQQFEQLCTAVLPIITPHLFNDGQSPISQTLKLELEKLTTRIEITDTATGGRLQNLLQTPKTYQQLHFNLDATDGQSNAKNLHVYIGGLTEYWENQTDCKETTLKITIKHNAQNKVINHSLPYREERTLLYAVELIAYELWRVLMRSLSDA